MGALFLYELTNIHSDNIIIFCIYFIIMTIGEALLSPEGTTLSGRLIHPNDQLYAVSLWGSVPGVGYFFSSFIASHIIHHNTITTGNLVSYLNAVIIISLVAIAFLILFVALEKKLTR